MCLELTELFPPAIQFYNFMYSFTILFAFPTKISWRRTFHLLFDNYLVIKTKRQQ